MIAGDSEVLRTEMEEMKRRFEESVARERAVSPDGPLCIAHSPSEADRFQAVKKLQRRLDWWKKKYMQKKRKTEEARKMEIRARARRVWVMEARERDVRAKVGEILKRREQGWEEGEEGDFLGSSLQRFGPRNEHAEGDSTPADYLEKVDEHVRNVEDRLEEERLGREEAEKERELVKRRLEEVEKEYREPFVVPALFEAMMTLGEMGDDLRG
ncbi:hypothetical protein OF83DRAFT_353703 [Amylostereum chailletii]|nr:hypothetical protein OF83DRAFT_353703 [Amylostereum chailletii]